MATLYGSLDRSYSPVVTIAVSTSVGPSHFVDAVIDTGFTGLSNYQSNELGPLASDREPCLKSSTRTDAPVPSRWHGRRSQLQRESDEAIVGLELVQISPPSGERLVGILSSDAPQAPKAGA
jgi:hypothetical protein